MTMVSVLACALFVACSAHRAHSQISLLGQFPTTNSVGIGFDHTTGELWVYPDSGAVVRRYSPAGALLGTVPRPGESANDADVEFTAGPITLGATALPEGTLLFINGESGTADIYAVNKSTGVVITSLATSFGASHVVGGAHHPQRGTIFMVQDRVPGGTAASRIAEINPQTGAVLNSFQVTAAAPTFTVNFGDIDIASTGNILVVSDDESTMLELTPTGGFVGAYALPTGVTLLAGIGTHPTQCLAWVIRTTGVVSQLCYGGGGPTCSGCDSIDFNADGVSPDSLDIEDLLSVYGGGPCSTGTCNDIDFNNDCVSPDSDDIESFLTVYGGGAC